MIKINFQNVKTTKRGTNPTNVEEAVKQVTPFVYKLASQYVKNHYNHYDDIIMAGYEGAIIAWNKFHDTPFEAQGYKYSSYAYNWIRHCIQEYASKTWKRMNNEAALTEFNQDKESYEHTSDLLDIRKMFEQLDPLDQQIMELRTHGETFDVIAEELGIETLHKARNRYMHIVNGFNNKLKG